MNGSSIPESAEIIFSFVLHPERIWGSGSLVFFGYWGPLTGSKAAGM
jgi:hypothetical protein